jgi:hypothetical protein
VTVDAVVAGDVAERVEAAPRRGRATADGAALRVPVDWLVPGASARAEDPEELAGLTTSIREAGVLEPLLVREVAPRGGDPGRRRPAPPGRRPFRCGWCTPRTTRRWPSGWRRTCAGWV